MSDYHERYSRQELIKNWDQKKISEARVAVVGGELFAAFVCLGLAALGIGEIRIITNEKEKKDQYSVFSKFKKYINYNGNEKAKTLVATLKVFNPTIKPIDIHTEMFGKEYYPVFNNPRVVIDITNKKESKVLCMEYCKERIIPFISGVVGDQSGLMNVNPDENELTQQMIISNQQQNPIISEILAGFIIDETRKVILPLNKNETLVKKTLKYNLTEKERFE